MRSGNGIDFERQINGLTYRLFDKSSDINELETLFRECFPEEYSEGAFRDYIEWMDSSPSGPGMQLVACDGRKIVGALSFLRQTIVGFGETYVGALAGNAMTASNYRRRGVYRTLSEIAFEELRKRDVHFVFGYTVQELVLRAEVKIGYSLIGDSKVYAFPLRPGKLLGLKRGLGWAGVLADGPSRIMGTSYIRLKLLGLPHDPAIVVREVKEFPVDIDVIANAKKSLSQYEVLKDARHLNWKYLKFYRSKEPHRFLVAERQGQVIGIGVCRRRPMRGLSGLAILDVLGVPELEYEAITSIVKKQILIAMEMHVDIIGCMVDEYSLLKQVLKKIGFLETDFRFRTIFKPLTRRLPRSIMEQRFWRHTWGNSDTL
ncbi:TPA: GNAT family N-acetyltransferase [Candidatus Bathyarchaeota archaeon]|nr:GNAT family N-acetyltransferase [Candidatus Bathyarchaeota archaeon]